MAMSHPKTQAWRAFTPLLNSTTTMALQEEVGLAQTTALFSVMEALAHLETVRHRPAVLYMGEDRAPFPKFIDDNDVLILYELLRRLGPLERLDLIINTSGGSVTTVRKLLHMVHSMVSHLTILVPYKACSAGTLLCLGAHDVLLTSIAELSPIDPYLEGMQGGKTNLFSSEDIATFRTMARDWFGVHSEDDAVTVLRLFCEKMFPPSLTHFFRAEQLVRQIALEALQVQLPEADTQTHQRIVEQLLTGYPDHLYPLNRTDLIGLGLHITPSTAEEEQLLWSIWAHGRMYLDTTRYAGGGTHVNGFLCGPHFCARHGFYTGAALPPKHQRDEIEPQFLHIAQWEVLDDNHDEGALPHDESVER